MTTDNLTPAVPAEAQQQASLATDVETQWRRVVRRRSFLKGLGVAGAAGAALPVGALTATSAAAASNTLTAGDAAILRFLATAEILESDLWQQYMELGGANSPTGGNAAYTAALQNLDSDMPQYITDNTDDEKSHAAFLNAYLKAHGAQPVNLEKFRTLSGSTADGAAAGVKRLTNLQDLNVDTSWYTRYRSDENPDFGDTFQQVVSITGKPGIPRNNADAQASPPNPPVTNAEKHIQAIANTAAFHFAMIEQGGSSLYTTLALKATSLEVLRIVVSIGGVEVDHFSLWHDKVGGAVSTTLAPLTDPLTGLFFPDLNNPPNVELKQTNKILPEPCEFIDDKFPVCSVIRPSTVKNSGAVAAVAAFTGSNLFKGQSEEFFDTIAALAKAADAAHRQ